MRCETRRRLLQRGVVLASATAASGIAASACIGSPQDASIAGAPTPGTRSGVTIAFAHDGATEAELQARRENLAAFVAQYPQFKTEQQSYPGTYNDKISTLVAAGTAPDVLYVGNGAQVTTRAAQGALLELGPLVRRDKFDTSDMFESAVALYQFCGKQYAYPIDFPNQQLYYNVDLFEQAGATLPPGSWNDDSWTFERFLDTARRVTKSPEAGSGQWGYMTGHTGFRSWWVWVAANGGEYFDKDLKTCLLNEPPAVEAFQFLQDLVFKHQVMPTPAQGAEAGGTLNGFINGRLAMSTNPPRFGELRTRFKQRWDVAPHPRGTGSRARRACAGGGTGLALASSAAGGKNTNEAWELLKFLETRPQVESYIRTVGIVPPLKSVANSTAFADPSQPPKSIKIFTDGAQYLRPDPSISRWTDIDRLVIEELTTLFNNSKSAKTVADSIKLRVDAILREITASGELACRQ
ncbi:MAG: sugar ABC transporter substrate-binding protein [Chloroflexota bacterium]|nr:sugar ABC transporter substrate-binding protein [Chloroflexota bacterium]